MTQPTMSPMHDQPPVLSAMPPMANWIAICSIIFGVLGLLCWGGQGATSIVTDPAEMGIEISEFYRVAGLVGYVVNFALAVMLLIAGVKGLGGAGGSLMRLWAWLKIVSVVLAVVTSIIFFDEILKMMSVEFDKSMEDMAAQGGGDQADMDSEAMKAMVGPMAVGVLVVQNIIQLIWPLVVLIAVKRDARA
ncbi:MAG: hypothetical protein MK074_00770 [Phycisphaerales bacterium]|nr:hypothetical protein [Phycisphaerales bacterium]